MNIRQAIGGAMIGLFVLLTVAWVVTGITIGIRSHFEWDVEYNREVRGHIENAYDANTPNLMVEELKLAKQGMLNLGLNGNVYAYVTPWKQTPDNRMDYQYDLMDSVIARAEAVAADRDRQIREGTSDQMGDVFEEKMDNLREFIKEGGYVDTTAYGAYYVQNHPFVAWFSDYFGINALVWLGLLIIMVGGGAALCAWGTASRY